MQINQVKTARKVGDFVKKKSGPNLIDIKYVLPNSELIDDIPRIYLMTSNGIIKKIGGSASKGGIKATMSFYTNSQQGSPGVARFVLHHLIAEEIDAGNNVELFMITSPKVKAPVNGLFGAYEIAVASFKEMEDLCKKDYFEIEGKYPEWNFQENSMTYPSRLAKLHNDYHNNRLTN